MSQNMNLTFPLGDWLFGTSDLNRGLLGHFFNGYSTKYLKKTIYAKKIKIFLTTYILFLFLLYLSLKEIWE